MAQPRPLSLHQDLLTNDISQFSRAAPVFQELSMQPNTGTYSPPTPHGRSDLM